MGGDGQIVAIPVVSSLSQTTGPTSGGYTVTITGLSLTGATAVSFGTTAASSFTVNSDTSITATVPFHIVGTVDVSVQTPNGKSVFSYGDLFHYINSAPTGADATFIVNESSTFTFSAANFGFSDMNDMLLHNFLGVYIDTLPGAGVLLLNGNAVTAGQFIAVADIPNLTYTAPAYTFGMTMPTFNFRVKDDGGTANGGIDTDPIANTITFNIFDMP